MVQDDGELLEASGESSGAGTHDSPGDITADDSTDSGMSPWQSTLLALVALLLVAGLVALPMVVF